MIVSIPRDTIIKAVVQGVRLDVIYVPQLPKGCSVQSVEFNPATDAFDFEVPELTEPTCTLPITYVRYEVYDHDEAMR